MSAISKYPIEFKNLSLPSVANLGWPPQSTHVLLRKNIESSDPIPLMNEKIDHHRIQSIGNDGESYFEKLRSAYASHITTANISSPIESQLDDTLEDLIRSIRPSVISNFDDMKNNQSPVKLLRQIYLEVSEQNTRQRFNNCTYTISTPDGNIFFDFSKQSINYSLYIQLMQLVRLSNLDKIIQKIFSKSGEYYHVDYRENRRRQLEIDQENYQYTLLSNISDRKSPALDDQMNFYLTMAKGVHFRTFSPCFVLNGIDISSRFQYDRKIIQDTCHRFHDDINTDANTNRKENNDSVRRVLVLCTDRMKEIYRLFESLFKSYILPNISIIYITFDQIKPILTRYEQLSDENTPISSGFQSTILSPLIDREKDANVTSVVPEENLEKIGSSDEEDLLDCFRTSSLILIFMKHLDESYLTTFIQWYTEIIHDSHPQFICNWSTIIEEYCWLITSDYQRAEIVFNVPKTNLFLWPTERHDFDPISIVISSILCLPIALSINYPIYSMFIDGMSIVDKHCQETTIDRNICIQMAVLRIWANINERKPTVIIIDDDLQSFGRIIHAKMIIPILGEYIQTLFTEYGDFYQHKMVEIYTSTTTIFLQQNNDRFVYDLIAKEKPLQDDKISHPYSLILFDRLTPLTLGVLIGVYQLSIFFENIIRNHPNIASDLNESTIDFHRKS